MACTHEVCVYGQAQTGVESLVGEPDKGKAQAARQIAWGSGCEWIDRAQYTFPPAQQAAAQLRDREAGLVAPERTPSVGGPPSKSSLAAATARATCKATRPESDERVQGLEV
eukprot:365983-Chlamydomonas_euryale.AAC.16